MIAVAVVACISLATVVVRRSNPEAGFSLSTVLAVIGVMFGAFLGALFSWFRFSVLFLLPTQQSADRESVDSDSSERQ